MTEMQPSRAGQLADAALACMMLALDPEGLGGALIRGPGGPARDDWVALFRSLLPSERRMFKVPPHTATDRLLGGLDVAATLKRGAPTFDRGLIAGADRGVLLLTSSERFTGDKAALLAAAMDEGDIAIAGDSSGERHAARFAVIACDEGVEEDERTPVILAERVAFLLELGSVHLPKPARLPDMVDACQRLDRIAIPDDMAAALCQTALALGIGSLRPALFALKAARVACALAGRDHVIDDDASTAARLVLAPRAVTFPAAEPPPDDNQEPEPPEPPPPADQSESQGEDDMLSQAELAEILLEAVKPALPPGLLARLDQEMRQRQSGKSGAGAASVQSGTKRGRPAGTRRGDIRSGAKLNLIDTLRAAAPWQRIRKRHAPERGGVRVERDDFRINRYKQKTETTAIFVVDASGSAALHRMAEAKGAVELILADCYVRRDRTALIAFRGKKADVLLPPTRSLQRARRCLADLPGGGGTPLANAIDASILVADQVRRGGGTPLIVFLTDGRANIARDGTPDRTIAMKDAHEAAKSLRVSGYRSLMIDMSDHPNGAARQVAESMAAIYMPLPHADATRISKTVSTAMKAQSGAQ